MNLLKEHLLHYYFHILNHYLYVKCSWQLHNIINLFIIMYLFVEWVRTRTIMVYQVDLCVFWWKKTLFFVYHLAKDSKQDVSCLLFRKLSHIFDLIKDFLFEFQLTELTFEWMQIRIS